MVQKRVNFANNLDGITPSSQDSKTPFAIQFNQTGFGLNKSQNKLDTHETSSFQSMADVTKNQP